MTYHYKNQIKTYLPKEAPHNKAVLFVSLCTHSSICTYKVKSTFTSQYRAKYSTLQAIYTLPNVTKCP